MVILGVGYHPSFQQIAFLDQETGECGERRLNHSDGEAEKFYRDVQQRGISVRVGMEATGYSRGFERLPVPPRQTDWQLRGAHSQGRLQRWPSTTVDWCEYEVHSFVAADFHQVFRLNLFLQPIREVYHAHAAGSCARIARVRQLSLERRLSREKVAELADLHRNYVGGTERG